MEGVRVVGHGDGLEKGSRIGRTLMLVPRLPVGSDWVTAAELAGGVAAVCGPAPLGNGQDLPLHPQCVRFSAMKLRPGRVFSGLNARLSGRALSAAVMELRRRGVMLDIAHGHFAAGSYGLPYLSERFGIPYVVSEHSSSLTAMNPEKRASLGELRRAQRVYERAAAVLPVSSYLEQKMREQGLMADYRVIPNPVNTELFRPVIGPRLPRVISVGRLARVKRLEDLMAAVAHASRTVPELRLDIVGEGPERARLEDLADQLSVGQLVTFHGRVERHAIPVLLARSSVFAMSSFIENHPVAMVEALACGVPVVGPNVGGIPEIVDGAPGGLFEAGDTEGMAARLLEWLYPSEEVQRVARESAVTRYSIETIARKLADVYRGCLGF
jgi:glycosyltransferase involved in cell wall biosynthesis